MLIFIIYNNILALWNDHKSIKIVEYHYRILDSPQDLQAFSRPSAATSFLLTTYFNSSDYYTRVSVSLLFIFVYIKVYFRITESYSYSVDVFFKKSCLKCLKSFSIFSWKFIMLLCIPSISLESVSNKFLIILMLLVRCLDKAPTLSDSSAFWI